MTEGVNVLPRLSVFVVPHPDDEVLRVSGYVDVCLARGDEMLLLAVTNGGASVHARRKGWSREYEEHYRSLEQDAAWAWLTAGHGRVHRLHELDGGARQEVVTDAVRALDDPLRDVEFYSCAHWDAVGADAHPDHIATAQGVLAAQPRVSRYAQQVGTIVANTRPGTTYRPRPERLPEVAAAHRCYDGLAREKRPLELMWQQCVDTGYATRVNRPPAV